MRLSWGRRHRDVALSDFRDGGVTGMSPGAGTGPPVAPAGCDVGSAGARSDFRDDPVREPPHLGPVVDEDAGNVTLSRPFEPPSGTGIKDRGHAVVLTSGRRT